MAATTNPYYYVWLTASSSECAELLCAKLIRRGFHVGPLGRQLITQHDDNPACVVAFSVHRTPRNDEERAVYNPHGIHAEVVDVVKHIKGRFWSLVVSEATACTWALGNERFSEEEKRRAEQAKKVN